MPKPPKSPDKEERPADDPRSGKYSKQVGEYAKYSGMVMQMGIIIFLGVFGGQQLDKRWQTDPWMTLVLSLAGIAIAFYVTLKDFFVSDKKD